jgi:hypothetical protein
MRQKKIKKMKLNEIFGVTDHKQQTHNNQLESHDRNRGGVGMDVQPDSGA